ncbi:unnamed protein product [Mytilus edulis]|uniref:Nuclear receptor domain-containing protein n=1 Tax=Mytilus edulis TaxID=6550 RepID=A0A8S3R1Z5_MYTED|nr:unnamed protein product [Mytilus edulis]
MYSDILVHRTLKCVGSCGLSSSLDDEVGFPADIKLESTNDCMPDEDKDFKVCVVCGEKASGFYFGALVCLPCKSFYIRCTKDGEPTLLVSVTGIVISPNKGRIRCQYCRLSTLPHGGMCRRNFSEEDLWKTRDIIVGEKSCQINPRNRNNCRYCRYQKCISAGMSREAIKMGRPKSQMEILHNSPLHIHHHFVIVVVRSCLPGITYLRPYFTTAITCQ